MLFDKNELEEIKKSMHYGCVGNFNLEQARDDNIGCAVCDIAELCRKVEEDEGLENILLDTAIAFQVKAAKFEAALTELGIEVKI